MVRKIMVPVIILVGFFFSFLCFDFFSLWVFCCCCFVGFLLMELVWVGLFCLVVFLVLSLLKIFMIYCGKESSLDSFSSNVPFLR